MTPHSSRTVEKLCAASVTIERFSAASFTSCWLTTFCISRLLGSESKALRNPARSAPVKTPSDGPLLVALSVLIKTPRVLPHNGCMITDCTGVTCGVNPRAF